MGTATGVAPEEILPLGADLIRNLSRSNLRSSKKSLQIVSGTFRSKSDGSWLGKLGALRKKKNGSFGKFPVTAVEEAGRVAGLGYKRLRSVLKVSPESARPDIASGPPKEQLAESIKEDDAEDEFAWNVIQATIYSMKWYFRSEFHSAALTLVLV